MVTEYENRRNRITLEVIDQITAFMTPERWQRVEEVLQAALDCAAPQRPGLLAELCADDAELQREAASLLEAHEAAGEFLEDSALEYDARLLLPIQN